MADASSGIVAVRNTRRTRHLKIYVATASMTAGTMKKPLRDAGRKGISNTLNLSESGLRFSFILFLYHKTGIFFWSFNPGAPLPEPVTRKCRQRLIAQRNS
jgi:hypothetical protein